MSISLRLAQPGDNAFLYAVYASTRADEMALTGWDAAQQESFLQMQFNAQWQYYHAQYPEAVYQVIHQDGVDMGRMIVDRSGENILMMDIALLPEYRGRGTGTTLIQGLMEEAGRSGKGLRLHVEFFNRALRLYERLGFSKIGATGIYYELEWRRSLEGVKTN